MGKMKKKGAQNSKAVAEQSIHGIKSGLVQKNKKPKFKSISGGDQATLLNNSKTQSKDKLPQKTTDTKSNQNLLQNNEKEFKKEQYSLEGIKNISNKPQNKSVIKEITLNFERNSKEKLEVDDSDSDINENIIPHDTLSDRNESYKEEELDLIISDIDRKRLAYNDKNVNDKFKWNLVRTMIRANDTVVEIKEEDKNGKDLLSYKQVEISGTAITVEFDVLKANGSETQEIKERFEKFGSIKKIRSEFKCAERFGKNAQLLTHIEKGDLVTFTVYINYHCPISARKAFSMNGQRFRGNCITVGYRVNYPLFLLDNRKCVCLSNLPFDMDNNTIWKVFSTCGEIEYVYLVHDEQTGFTKEIGWIVFMNEDAVKKAVELNGTVLLDYPVIVRADYPNFFCRVETKKIGEELTTKELEKVSAKYKAKQDLLHKSNDNNPSKKFKNNSGEAVARKAGNERNQESRKSNASLVENKPSTSFQDQKANFKKNNKKFNKQKKQLARKFAAKPNKPAKV